MIKIIQKLFKRREMRYGRDEIIEGLVKLGFDRREIELFFESRGFSEDAILDLLRLHAETLKMLEIHRKIFQLKQYVYASLDDNKGFTLPPELEKKR
jgi:hypothetical protein